MKKHSFIQVDFQSAVKLAPKDLTKMSKWLNMASDVMEQLVKKEEMIHASWLKKSDAIRVSVLLCGEAKIKKLNREYRGKDYVTDVLSFPTHESLRTTRPKDIFPAPEIFLGDLAICHQKAIKQAKEFDITYWDEFIHLYMHGLIHLMGYDHEISSKEEKLMQKWEKEALDLFSKLKNKK